MCWHRISISWAYHGEKGFKKHLRKWWWMVAFWQRGSLTKGVEVVMLKLKLRTYNIFLKVCSQEFDGDYMVDNDSLKWSIAIKSCNCMLILSMQQRHVEVSQKGGNHAIRYVSITRNKYGTNNRLLWRPSGPSKTNSSNLKCQEGRDTWQWESPC